MKIELLKKLTMVIAFFAAITITAQQGPTLYNFSGGAQGWVKGYGAGTVAHAPTEGTDGALTLDRALNNNANIRRGQGGDNSFIVLDRAVYNYIKIVYKNETAATSFRIQGQSRVPGGTAANFSNIVVPGITNGVSQASNEFSEVVIDISSIPAGHEVTRLDILVRENAASDASGSQMVFESIEFLESNSGPIASGGTNIILILTDDMGYADVGYNNSGFNDIATPNIDALANAGTKFTSAYVTHPFCGPSRAGLMTGRYPHEFGAQYNLSDSNTTQGVDLNETFFSTVLDDAGYNTGIIGKWHLGQPTGYRPNQRGFDYFYGMLYGGHVYFTGGGGGSAQYTSPLRENEGLAGEANGLYVTDLFTDKGVEFINNSEANDDQPFFLFMSYNAPHTPLQPLPSDVTALASPPYNFTYSDTKRRDYAAMVYSVDRGIKSIVDALTANGELDNTLIVFLSDNGGRTDQGAINSPLRGRKGDTLEGGFRVPMFMYWPNGGNGIPAGQSYDFNVSALDLYPTFVNLANGTIPNGKELDGKDILSNIQNNTDARSGESIYSIRHRFANNLGIRRGDYKAYHDSNSNNWYLYDINANIGENNGQALNTNIEPYKSILAQMANDAYLWSLTHIEPLFFDSSTAENTWLTNHSNTTHSTTWQDVLFNGFNNGLSIDDIELNQNVTGYIYPNPVQSDVTVKLNQSIFDNVDITVYDIYGRPVQINNGLKVNNSNTFDFILNATLSKGTYLLKVKSNAGTFSKTFLKN